MLAAEVEALPLRGERLRAVTAGLLFPLAVAAWDLRRVLGSAPQVAPGAGVLVFVSVGWALGAVLWCTALVAHGEVAQRLLRAGPSGAALCGALEAFALYALCVIVQDPRTLDMDARVWLLAGCVAISALLRWAFARAEFRGKATVARAFAFACVVFAVVALARLRWNGQSWVRLALHGVAAVALSFLLPAVLLNATRKLTVPALACALALALGSGALLDRSTGARLALHHKSSHVRAWAGLYQQLADGDGDGATDLFGGRDCDPGRARVFPGASEQAGNGVDDNCMPGGAETALLTSSAGPFAAHPHPGRGASAGNDVVILSVDSLRWDAAGELRELRAALGEVAEFDRALSPAPGTKESLSATLRGRAVRQLRFEEAELARGPILWRDDSPTLAHGLVAAGYRAITVPTSNIADPRIGIPAGFESIWVANYDARRRPAARSPFTQDYVPAEQVLPLALQAARDTRGPLCLWLHLMETHSPYHVPPAAGESGRARFERAVGAIDAQLAGLVRELETIRGRKPLVAVFGDHGEEFGEHGGEHHASSVYAEQVRVAFWLAGPGVPPGRHAQPVSTAQLPATLLDLLGLALPASMTEPSLLPALMQQGPWPELAVSELRGDPAVMIAYTGPRYRYLYDPVNDVELLFDSARDPLDRLDVSAAQPKALQRMRALARDWDEAH